VSVRLSHKYDYDPTRRAERRSGSRLRAGQEEGSTIAGSGSVGGPGRDRVRHLVRVDPAASDAFGCRYHDGAAGRNLSRIGLAGRGGEGELVGGVAEVPLRGVQVPAGGVAVRIRGEFEADGADVAGKLARDVDGLVDGVVGGGQHFSIPSCLRGGECGASCAPYPAPSLLRQPTG